MDPGVKCFLILVYHRNKRSCKGKFIISFKKNASEKLALPILEDVKGKQN